MTAASIIGQSTVVRGNVHGEGSLEIQGKVEGDVRVEGDVVIGEQSVVTGSVSAGQISVSGTVEGDLTGSEAVLVERGARVTGDMTAPRIGIANGALVRGMVCTDGSRAAATPRRALDTSGRVPAVARPESEPAASPYSRPEPEARTVQEAEPDLRFKNERPPKGKPPEPVVPSIGKGTKGRKKGKGRRS